MKRKEKTRKKKDEPDRLEQRLFAFGREHAAEPKEDLIKETIQKCTDLAIGAEQQNSEKETIHYGEFFRMQVKLIQKRWWVLQAVILILAWLLLDSSAASQSVQRIMSVAAVLFVILIMPEIWKNRETNSMEIEKAAFYSLRQIYSAKLLAFGLVDTCIINLFCFTAVNTYQIPVYDLLKQFIFPLMVATGICFGIFCSKRNFSEVTALFTCVIANGIWILAIINEAVYTKITALLWGILFAISAAAVFLSIRKTICDCDKLWEVNRNDINFG